MNQYPSRWSVGLILELDDLGQKLYGEQWPKVKAANVERLVGEGKSASDLNVGQLQQLVSGLKRLEQSRRSLR